MVLLFPSVHEVARYDGAEEGTEEPDANSRHVFTKNRTGRPVRVSPSDVNRSDARKARLPPDKEN